MFKRLGLALSFAVLLGCGLTPAFAQESLAEKKKWREQEELLAVESKQATKACEKEIGATFNKPSFKGELETNNSFHGFCAEAYKGLSSICSDPDGKAAVKKKISQIECTFGGKGKRSLSLNGETLQMTIDWEVIQLR